MKKTLKIIGIMVAGLVVIIGLMIVGLILPAVRESKEARPIVTEKANEFIDCLTKNDSNHCYEQMTSENFKSSVSSDQLKMLADKIKSALGNRLSGTIVDESFNFKTVKDTKESKKVTSIEILSIYDNDLSVRESYMFEQTENSKEYKLSGFHVTSAKLFK